MSDLAFSSRAGGFPRPLLHPLPEPIRYQLGEEDGKKVVKINTIFPTYKLRRNQLPLYIWETLALEYAKAEDPDTQTVEEYIVEMNELLRDLGTFIRKKGVKITG